MNIQEAALQLRELQAQIIHGPNVFGEMADAIDAFVREARVKAPDLDADAEGINHELFELRAKLAETEKERKNAELRAIDNIDYCHGLWMKWLHKMGFVDHATFEGYIEDAECAEDSIRSILGKISYDRDQLRSAIERKDAALKDVIENGLLGDHTHWDSTMQRGAGCPVCIRQREVSKRVATAISPPDTLILERLTGTWKAKCAVCGAIYENRVGSTECCGALQYIIEHNPEESAAEEKP